MSEFLEFQVDKFTFRVALDRYYTAEGVWVKAEKELVRIGLSDFLQQRSGDVAFAELKPVGTQVRRGDEVAVIETIKVNLSLAAPVSGQIVEINPEMEIAPEAINQDPYEDGWLVMINPSDWKNDQPFLMDASTYFEQTKRQAEDEVR
jgi:glycine cleavage system H protein